MPMLTGLQLRNCHGRSSRRISWPSSGFGPNGLLSRSHIHRCFLEVHKTDLRELRLPNSDGLYQDGRDLAGLEV